MFLPILIQHRQVCDSLEVFLGWWVVVDLDVPLEICGRIFDRHLIEGGAWVFADSINPEDKRYESNSE